MLSTTRFRCLIGAVFLSTAVPVLAAPLIDFEPEQTMVFAGDSYLQAGFRVTPTGGDGLVDFSYCDPFGEYCAVGNDTSYMTALNDASVTITRVDDAAFNLRGFDASFFPSPWLNFTGELFRLMLSGTTGAGNLVTQEFDLFEDLMQGNFLFSSYIAAPAFNNLNSLTFDVCWVQGTSCVAPILNDAQFAIDNIAFNDVPEPSAAWLVAMSLAGLMFARRRNQS